MRMLDIVHKFSVGGARDLVCFAAYEPSSYFGPHGSLMTLDGNVCGSLQSRRLPASIDEMPIYAERLAACDAFRKANEAEAYAAIVEAYPEATDGLRRNGEIEVRTGQAQS